MVYLFISIYIIPHVSFMMMSFHSFYVISPNLEVYILYSSIVVFQMRTKANERLVISPYMSICHYYTDSTGTD